jgi:hypothetical protein
MTAAVPSRMRPEREIQAPRHRCQACYDTGLVAGRGQGLQRFLPCTCQAGDTMQANLAGEQLQADVEAGGVSCRCGARASVITAGVARCRKCSRAFVDEWKRKRSLGN